MGWPEGWQLLRLAVLGSSGQGPPSLALRGQVLDQGNPEFRIARVLGAWPNHICPKKLIGEQPSWYPPASLGPQPTWAHLGGDWISQCARETGLVAPGQLLPHLQTHWCSMSHMYTGVFCVSHTHSLILSLSRIHLMFSSILSCPLTCICTHIHTIYTSHTTHTTGT